MLEIHIQIADPQLTAGPLVSLHQVQISPLGRAVEVGVPLEEEVKAVLLLGRGHPGHGRPGLAHGRPLPGIPVEHPSDLGVRQDVVVHPADPVLVRVIHQQLQGCPVQINRVIKAHGQASSSIVMLRRNNASYAPLTKRRVSLRSNDIIRTYIIAGMAQVFNADGGIFQKKVTKPEKNGPERCVRSRFAHSVS